MTDRLTNRRILVVEDELLIAMSIEATLEDVGLVVIGPFPRAARAARAAREDRPDLALLDVRVADGDVYPAADALADRGVPFAFLTGYQAGDIPLRHRGRPVLMKPFARAQLLGTLAALMTTPAGVQGTADA